MYANQPHMTVFMDDRSMILSAVRCLISNDDCLRSQAQIYLSNMCRTRQVYLIQTLLQLILSQESTSTQQKHLCLLYLRNMIKTSKSCLPSNLLQTLKKSPNILQKHSPNLSNISKQCLILFLNKPRHQKHKKAYIDSLITLLSITLMEDKIIDVDVIDNVIQVLGDPIMKKKCGMMFSSKNQKTVHHVINKYSTGLQNGDKMLIKELPSQIWVSFILALCNYSGFVPPLQFIYKNITKQEMYAQQTITLSQLFIKTHYKFTSANQLYNIMSIQLNRINDNNFVKKLQEIEQNGQEMFGIIVKSIELAVCDMLGIYTKFQQENKKANNMFGVSIIQEQQVRDVYSMDFFVNMVSYILNSYTKHFVLSSDHIQIPNLASICLQKYDDSSIQQLIQYTNCLCQKLKQNGHHGMQSVYWLMANIKPQALQYFDYSSAILCGMQEFNTMFCKIKSNNNMNSNNTNCNNDKNMNQINYNNHEKCNNDQEEQNDKNQIWSHFVAMMEHYVKNSHKQQINLQTLTISKQFIQFCLNQSNKFIDLHLRCMIFSLYCQCQIKFQLKSHHQFQKSLQFGFTLLNQCFQSVTKQNTNYNSFNIKFMGISSQQKSGQATDSQSIQIILDSLRDISIAATNIQSSNSCIIYFHNTLTQYLSTIMTQNSSNLSISGTYLPHILHIIQSYITIQMVTPILISVLNQCLCPSQNIKNNNINNNNSLQYQACSLYLRILILFNRSSANLLQISISPCNSLHFYAPKQIQQFISNIQNCGILTVIQQRLISQDDQVLYTRIMMQLIIYPSIAYKIQQILINRVIPNIKYSLVFTYYFDIVIQALAILYNLQCEYSKNKGINRRVDDIKMGHMEKLMQGLNVNQNNNISLNYRQQQEYQESYQYDNNNNDKYTGIGVGREIKWYQLGGVRVAFGKESVAGIYIYSKIHDNK